MTIEWTKAEAGGKVEIPEITRMEPAGDWGGDREDRITLNGVFFTGVQTLWYETGQKYSETPYHEGKIMDGTQIVWHPNGQKWWERPYKNGKLDGIKAGWHPNGQKHFESPCSKGLAHGTQFSWYPNGKKYSEMSFREGRVIDGTYITWYSNGKKYWEETFRGGKRDGVQVVRHPNGQKQFEVTYVQGERVEQVNFDKRGRETQRLTFKDGRPFTQDGKPYASIMFGAQLRADSDHLTVTSVTSGSPAAQASLQVGDRLLTVEGQPVPKTEAGFMAQLVSFAEGSFIPLGIERAGKRHTLRLHWTRQEPSIGLRLPSAQDSGQAPMEPMQTQEPKTGPSGQPLPPETP